MQEDNRRDRSYPPSLERAGTAFRKAWEDGKNAAIGGALLGMLSFRFKVAALAGIGAGLVGAGVSLYRSLHPPGAAAPKP